MKIFVIFVSCQIKTRTQFVENTEYWERLLLERLLSVRGQWGKLNLRSAQLSILPLQVTLRGGSIGCGARTPPFSPFRVRVTAAQLLLSVRFATRGTLQFWNNRWHNSATVGGSLTSLCETKILLPATCRDWWHRECHTSTGELLLKTGCFCQEMSGRSIQMFLVCHMRQFLVCCTLFWRGLEHVWVCIQWRWFLRIPPSQLLMLHRSNCSEAHCNNLFIMAQLH